jgi:hypothetical protein
MPACATGLGGSLIAAGSETDTKFTTTNFKVRGISGGGRTLTVIDDSHLGQSRGRPMLKCYGDLFEWEPFVVDAQLDTENLTLFADVDEGGTTPNTTVYTNRIDNPVLLGVPDDDTPPLFALTIPTITLLTSPVLVFSGAIIRDSGYNFTIPDRNRITLTIQPDGQKVDWTVGT